MSFGTGLSGIAAANTDLSVTGNNIANASTTGFKTSRTEFGDAYTTSMMGMGSDVIGSGVSVTNIGQKFEQGSISSTDSSLDLAIDGEGFFVTEYDNGTVTYTRSGIFGLDTEGYVVSNSGAVLQGYGVDENGIVSGILTDIQVDADNIDPQRTTQVDTQLNLPSYAEVLQSTGTVTTTDGLAVGVVQTGEEDDVATTLSAISYPTTAGTAAELIGGATRVDFPWQPTAAESSWSIDIALVGTNIDTSTNSVTATIQPFSDENIYTSVDDLVSAINSAINADADIAGMVQATVNDYGGITFETAGTYATDGTSIVGITDNVGTLLDDDYLNLTNQTVVLQGSADTGLSVVAADTNTTLTSGRDLTTIDDTPFLDTYAGEDIEFLASVDGTSYTMSITIPAGGYASYADLATALDTEFATVGASVDVAYSGDRLVFTESSGGDIDMYFQATSSTSTFDVDTLGFTSSATYAPSTVQGVDANDDLTITLDGPLTDTITLSAATYPDAESLAQEINTQIAASATLNGEVEAYAVDDVLYFDRLTNSTSASIAITGSDPDYYGLEFATTISTPDVISPVAGTDLFADGGYLDLSSDEGEAVSIQGNSASELTFNDEIAGTYTEITSGVSLNSLDNTGAFADSDAGDIIAFSISVAGDTESITMTVPAGGYTDQDDFAANLEADINAAFGYTAVGVSVDATTSQLVITAGTDVGVGPQTISLNDLSSTVSAPLSASSININTLGLDADDSSPAPSTELGEAVTAANNQLEISIDGADEEIIVIPEGTYSSYSELVDTINSLIDSNSNLAGEIEVSQVNGRLVIERTEVGDYPLDIEIDGTDDALEAMGLDSITKTTGEDAVDRSNSFTINLTVPAPDEDDRSGSVTISLDETIYSIDQLASSINRELASVEEDEYIGVQAIVETDDDGNEYLTLVATEAGEESTISITNIQATGEDLDVNDLYGLLQADEYDTDLLLIGEAAVTNGYPEQTFEIYNEDEDTTETITIAEGSQASEIASQLSDLAGVTATGETNLTLFADSYVNSGEMDFYVNGQLIESDDFDDIVDEINSYSSSSLSSITAALDADTGDIVITSSIGIDISVEIDTPTETDTITLQGVDSTADTTLGGSEDAETYAVVGGEVEIVLNEGYSLSEPDPRVTGLFNGLTDDSFEDYTINAFDADDTGTYNETSSITIYDSLGNQHELQMYYVKNEASDSEISSWTVYVQIDGEDVGDPDATLDYPDNLDPTTASFQLYFNADGSIDEDATGDFLISNWDPIDDSGDANGSYTSLNVAEGGSLPVDSEATNSNFAISFTDTTQYGSDFARYDFQQDGYTSGELTDLEIDSDGIIYARYTNGEAEALGQVALATFANTEGLTPTGDTEWVSNSESGDATIGEPGTGTLGTIQSSALEDSTVDLSEELVQLIIAQRNYQASAKTIETANEVTQTIINLR